MTHFHIGATTTDMAPCYSTEAWGDLLAALSRNDHEAVIRITTTAKPHYVATAKLQEVETPSMADAAAAYWAKRGKTPKARATDASGVPIVLEVRR